MLYALLKVKVSPYNEETLGCTLVGSFHGSEQHRVLGHSRTKHWLFSMSYNWLQVRCWRSLCQLLLHGPHFCMTGDAWLHDILLQSSAAEILSSWSDVASLKNIFSCLLLLCLPTAFLEKSVFFHLFGIKRDLLLQHASPRQPATAPSV